MANSSIVCILRPDQNSALLEESESPASQLSQLQQIQRSSKQRSSNIQVHLWAYTWTAPSLWQLNGMHLLWNAFSIRVMQKYTQSIANRFSVWLIIQKSLLLMYSLKNLSRLKFSPILCQCLAMKIFPHKIKLMLDARHGWKLNRENFIGKI